MTARIAVVVALSAFPAVADEKKPPTLDGKWEIISTVFDGEKKAGKGRYLVFKGNEFTAHDGDKKGRTLSFKFDDSARPNSIDIERADGQKSLGIYALEKDELKLCYAEPGGSRPKELESKAGDKVFLLVLKKVK